MPFLQSGIWVPDLAGKQWEVWNSYDRAVLVSGGRKSGKSWGILHRIARHMWETPDARVGMFTKVLKNSKDAGMWKNLHNYTIKEWISANIGFRYTTKRYEDDKPGPKVDGTTRTPFFRTTNLHGGESECMLFSLDNPNEAEEKLKEREFSMIYFSELSNFPERSVLSLGLMCLRMPYLDFRQQQWIADTNPAPEGEKSWIYEVWYVERNLDYQSYVDRQRKLSRPVMKEETFVHFVSNLRLVEINAADNPKLKAGELQELEATYAYDQPLHERLVNGKWTYGGAGAGYHFRAHFKKSQHVIGFADGVEDDGTWVYANPSEKCFALTTGFDIGETNNHAGIILEKTMVQQYYPQAKKTAWRACFTVLDELVSLGEFVTLESFTIEFMRLIDDLETLCGRQFNLDEAISDSSTLDKWNAATGQYPAETVEAAAFGRLNLLGVNKRKFSPQWRVQIVQQLLAFGRLKVSAHCFNTIEMFENLKRGTQKLHFILQTDPNRHIFDALSYAISTAMEEESIAVPLDQQGGRGGLVVSIR